MVDRAFDVNRRGLFAVAAGAAGLAGTILTGAPVARAQEAAPAAPDLTRWRRFNLGSFTVTVYMDGMRKGDGPHPIFGANQDAATVEALLAENFLPGKQFVNSFSPTLVQTGTETILFDTGLGAGARANGMGNLAAMMAASGVQPGDVTVVAITHMHGDHVGGLMENGAPAFPNARYIASATEYDHWTKVADAEAGKTVAANVVPLAEKMTFVKDGDSVASGVTAMAAHGHSPGHTIYHLESDGRRLVITADTANHYVLSLQRPDWEVRFDMDKAAAAATRKSVFGMLAADKVPFVGYHMPFPAVGFVEPMGDGFRYVPATYQFDV